MVRFELLKVVEWAKEGVFDFYVWGDCGAGVRCFGDGLYASGKAIHDGGGSWSWRCAENSVS